MLSLEGGGVAIQTWMLDHVFPGTLGTISRELSYLDAQGGRVQGFAGGRLDRNVVLLPSGLTHLRRGALGWAVLEPGSSTSCRQALVSTRASPRSIDAKCWSAPSEL